MANFLLINAGVTHPHRPWLDRLAGGGPMVLPITISMGATGLGKGVMARIVRAPSDEPKFSARLLTLVAIYSCSNVRDAQLEPLLGKASATGVLMRMNAVRVDGHETGERCIVHRGDVCLSFAESP